MNTESIKIIIDIVLKQKKTIEDLSKQFIKLQTSSNLYKNSIKSLSPLFSKLASGASQVAKSFDNITASTNKSNMSRQEMIRSSAMTVGWANKHTAALKKQSTAAKETAQSVNKLVKANQSLRSVSRAFQDLGSAIRFSLLTKGLTDLSKGILDTSINWIRFGNTLKYVYGSAEKSEEILGFLSDTSEKLGVSFEKSISGFSQLAAAAKGTALEGQPVLDIYQSLVETSSALGLSQYKLESIFYAITQMISKGTVQTEELKRQLGDQLPGAMEKAAESMGMTREAFMKAVKAGEVSADVFLKAFAPFLHKEFAETAKINSKTIIGGIERLKKAWYIFKVELGKGEFLNIISDAFVSLTKSLKNKEVIDLIKAWITGFIKLSGAFVKFVTEYPKVSLAIVGLATSFALLVNVFTPITTIIVNIIRLQPKFLAFLIKADGVIDTLILGVKGLTVSLWESFAALGAVSQLGILAAITAAAIALTVVIKDQIKLKKLRREEEEKWLKSSKKYIKGRDLEIKSYLDLTKMTKKSAQAYEKNLEVAFNYYRVMIASAEAANKPTDEYNEKLQEIVGTMKDLQRLHPDLTFFEEGDSKKIEKVVEAFEKLDKVKDVFKNISSGYSVLRNQISDYYDMESSKLSSIITNEKVLFSESLKLAEEKSKTIIALGESEYNAKLKYLDKIKVSETDYVDAVSIIDKNLLDLKKQTLSEWKSFVKSSYDEALGYVKSYSDKVKEIEDEIQEARKTTDEKIKDLQRSLLTDEQQWYAKRSDANKLLEQSREALAEGTNESYKKSAEYAKEAQKVFSSLAKEIKSGDKTLISKSQSTATAISGIKDAGNLLNEALSKQKDIAEETKDKWVNAADTIKQQFADIELQIKDLNTIEISPKIAVLIDETEFNKAMERFNEKSISVKGIVKIDKESLQKEINRLQNIDIKSTDEIIVDSVEVDKKLKELNETITHSTHIITIKKIKDTISDYSKSVNEAVSGISYTNTNNLVPATSVNNSNVNNVAINFGNGALSPRGSVASKAQTLIDDVQRNY